MIKDDQQTSFVTFGLPVSKPSFVLSKPLFVTLGRRIRYLSLPASKPSFVTFKTIIRNFRPADS